jgi:hypothetical protein
MVAEEYMMPVVRIPDDVFERLQALATPLVDTPGSVIKRLLDMHEPNSRKISTSASSAETEVANPLSATTTGIDYETYENRSNPHVTIHRVGCSQLRKRGGIHRHGQGRYKAHGTLAEAGSYAVSTGLPVKLCGYCKTSGDDVARQLVIDYVRANPGRDWQEAEIKRATGIGKDRVRGLVLGHPEIDQDVLADGAVRWKPQAIAVVP